MQNQLDLWTMRALPHKLAIVVSGLLVIGARAAEPPDAMDSAQGNAAPTEKPRRMPAADRPSIAKWRALFEEVQPAGTKAEDRNAYGELCVLVEEVCGTINEACAAFPDSDGKPPEIEWTYLPSEGVTPEDQGRAAKATQMALQKLRESGVWEKLLALHEVRRAVPEIQDDWYYNWTHYELGYCRCLTRFCLSVIEGAAGSGDGATVVEAGRVIFSAARITAFNPSTLARSVSTAILDVVHSRIVRLIESDRFPRRSSGLLLEALADLDTAPPLSYQLRAEYIALVESFDLVFEDEGGPNVREFAALFEGESGNGANMKLQDVEKMGVMLAFGRHLMRPWCAKAAEEFHSRSITFAELSLEQHREFEWSPDDWLRAHPRVAIVKVLSPVGIKLYRHEAARATVLVSLRTLLMLQQFKDAHGAYPDTLAELGRGVLNDPFTDQPLRYHRSGERFLLYSVGYDGVDDGGIFADDPEDLFRGVYRFDDGRKVDGLDVQLVPSNKAPNEQAK